jgi:hypothetical protein
MGPAQPTCFSAAINERKQVEFPRSSEKERQIMMSLAHFKVNWTKNPP